MKGTFIKKYESNINSLFYEENMMAWRQTDQMDTKK